MRLSCSAAYFSIFPTLPPVYSSTVISAVSARPDKPPSIPKLPGKAQRIIFHFLKTLTAIFLAVSAVLFLSTAILIFRTPLLAAGTLVTSSLCVLLTVLGILLVWHAWRLFKEPFNLSTQNSSVSAFTWWNELCAASTASDHFDHIQSDLLADNPSSALDTVTRLLAVHPNDLALLWMYATFQRDLNNPAAAEKSFQLLLHQLASGDPQLPHHTDIQQRVAAEKLHAIMLQNDGRFEHECTTVVRSLVTDTAKITLLDQLACVPLIHEKPNLNHLAEFCIRKALQIAPGTLTLQGTLGAILAERGQFAEAEPLLRACYNGSADPINRGITSYYLALLAEHKADPATARQLANQSIALYPEPWLTAKAHRLLARQRPVPHG